MCTAGMAASTRRFELGETHGEHRPVRHAERRHGVCCCTGSHARSAWYLHRWGYSTPSGPGGWCPPFELSTVASWCLAPRRPSARALLCRAASHWRCSSSRGSSARSHCTGSQAQSAWYLHRWGYSTPSGPGGWCPHPELGTVASRCLVSRRSARALYCAVPPHTGGALAVARARARAAMAVTREARGTSIDGVSFSSVPCQASTVPFPMTSPFWAGRHPLLFLSPISLTLVATHLACPHTGRE